MGNAYWELLQLSFGLRARKSCRICGNRTTNSDCSHYFPVFYSATFLNDAWDLCCRLVPRGTGPARWDSGKMQHMKASAASATNRDDKVGLEVTCEWSGELKKSLPALPRSGGGKRIWAVPVACSGQEPCWEHRRNAPYLINTPSFSTSSLQNKYTASAINHIIINNAVQTCGGGEFGTNPAFEWCSLKMKSSA